GGVVILDADADDTIGAGRLVEYQINSNTHASKFASNVIRDRPDSVPPEIASGTLLE
ncbi:unnamed protein product, partial [Discosporangium mesarthrocarpum]